jgi:nucleotide-binding universal stress UspA family protein
MNKKQNMKVSSIRKIVIATDFSRASNRAFSFSIKLAKQLDAEVIAVFVKNADDLAIAMRQNIPLRRKELDQLKVKVNRFIDRKLQSLLKHATNDDQIRFVVLEGKPWQEILRLAKREKAGLIVTGTRSRSVASLFLGSTARELILNSFCPVVTLNEKRPRTKGKS